MTVFGSVILIKPDKLPERTLTGHLIIPKNSKEMLPEWGVVMQVGPVCKEIRQGERVQFPRKLANVIVIDDTDYYLINEYKILYHE